MRYLILAIILLAIYLYSLRKEWILDNTPCYELKLWNDLKLKKAKNDEIKNVSGGLLLGVAVAIIIAFFLHLPF